MIRKYGISYKSARAKVGYPFEMDREFASEAQALSWCARVGGEIASLKSFSGGFMTMEICAPPHNGEQACALLSIANIPGTSSYMWADGLGQIRVPARKGRWYEDATRLNDEQMSLFEWLCAACGELDWATTATGEWWTPSLESMIKRLPIVPSLLTEANDSMAVGPIGTIMDLRDVYGRMRRGLINEWRLNTDPSEIRALICETPPTVLPENLEFNAEPMRRRVKVELFAPFGKLVLAGHVDEPWGTNEMILYELYRQDPAKHAVTTNINTLPSEWEFKGYREVSSKLIGRLGSDDKEIVYELKGERWTVRRQFELVSREQPINKHVPRDARW